MDKIQLLYVENVISRANKALKQTLNFFIWVENLNYDKEVEVFWSGDDGKWQVSAAQYVSSLDREREYWQLTLVFNQTAQQKLPGDIQFSLRYRDSSNEQWDNNQGQNYLSQANSGIQLRHGLSLLNIDFPQQIEVEQQFIPITVAVDPALLAEKVVIHWTTDNWQHSQQTPCHFKKSRRNSNTLQMSNHHHSVQSELWKGRLRVNSVFRLQYCIVCYGNNQERWDNNFGQNYSAQRKALKIMILNLHCYQEDNQDFKFSQIAKAVDDLDVDVVCLQEVAEFWNNGQGDWYSNSARIINERLQTPFDIYTDWSHLGFDKYREGVAILSRYRMQNHEARYVSESHDVYSIHSRKVVSAQIQVPGVGLITLFSAHLSWWEDGFETQFQRLSRWAAERSSHLNKATLLCGDFNIAAGSQGYEIVVNANEYEDQFLAVNAQGVFEKIFRVNDPHWRHYLADDYRIDYIFMNKNSALKVIDGDVLFTEDDYGRVSDHCGYVMSFEPE